MFREKLIYFVFHCELLNYQNSGFVKNISQSQGFVEYIYI